MFTNARDELASLVDIEEDLNKEKKIILVESGWAFCFTRIPTDLGPKILRTAVKGTLQVGLTKIYPCLESGDSILWQCYEDNDDFFREIIKEDLNL